MKEFRNYPDSLRFSDQFKHHILDNLSKFTALPVEDAGKRRAAVALVVVTAGNVGSIYDIHSPDPERAALILTRRGMLLKKHAGQWALPGGRLDCGETPEEAALRELQEETGLKLTNEAILGRLDDFSTRSGFIITPVIVWGGKDVHLTPHPVEVDSIHRIPVSEFLREDAPVLEEIPESTNPVLFMPVGNGWIASPTGAILYQFREVALLGQCVRVSHYEQPYFAWR